MVRVLYLDETGHAADPAKLHVGVGGLLAPVDTWSQIETGWLDVLKDFGLSAPFHMMDFASGSGQFVDWPEVDRRKLLGSLVSLFTRGASVRPVATVVCLQAYRNLTEAERMKLGEPYFIALESCIRQSSLGLILNP